MHDQAARPRLAAVPADPPRGPASSPRNADGRVSRSLTTDDQKDRAGLMTAAGWAEHTALRRGAAAGRVPGLVRLAGVPRDDSWYAVTAC